MLPLLLACCALLTSPVPPLDNPPPDDVVVVENGQAALADGSVRRGEFTIDRTKSGKAVIRILDGGRRKKLRWVVLLLDGDGAVAHPLPPTLDHLDGFRSLATDENPEHPAEAFLRYAMQITDPEHPLRAALLAEALTADPEHEASLQTLEGMPSSRRLAILRALVEANPDRRETEKVVRRGLPGDLRLYGRIDARGWLHYLETAERLGVTLLGDPEDPAPEWKAEKRKLGAAINTRIWGEEDLVGFRSEHLYLISSSRDPWLLAGCLQRGEAVVRALTEIFASVEAKREPRYPLLIFLYSSPEEYEEKGRRARNHGNGVPHNSLGGRYCAVDSTTRVFPPEGEDAVARVQEVLAHELTHHWMHACCPGLTAAEAGSVATRSGPDRPGTWVDEGFAALVQDFRFDEEAGTYESVNPLSVRLDIIATAGYGSLLPWEEVFEGTIADFDRLSPNGGIQIPSRLDRKLLRHVPEHGFFFAQSAATCGYLFHHDAASRRRLLDYLLAYYRGDLEALEVQRTLGLSMAELGKQARLYAADRCRRERK
jgi:hypothetical protein